MSDWIGRHAFASDGAALTESFRQNDKCRKLNLAKQEAGMAK